MNAANSRQRDCLLPVLAKLPFGVYILLGMCSLLLCAVGVILFMMTAAFDSREAFEDAAQAAGLRLNDNCPGECVRDGTVYRAVSGGKIRSWPEGHPERAAVCSLEVPHWPPPIPVCWGMAALGLLGTAAFLGTVVKIEEYRAARSVKNRRNG